MDDGTVPPERRRFFLTVILGAVGAALAGLAAWPLWEYLSPRPGGGKQGRVVVDKSAVPVGGAHFFQFQGHPAVVVQNAPGQFLAFSAICTHLGCIVQWQPDKEEFLCPCHAGRFSPTGQVLGGPPPQPLESIPVTVAGEQVLVG